MQRRGECTEEELKKQTLTFDVQSLSYLDLSRRGVCIAAHDAYVYNKPVHDTMS